MGHRDVQARPTSVMKRAIDLVGSVVLLVVLSPVWIASALAIVVTSGRPVLFRQERIGRDFVPFRVYKFRTMKVDNDDSAHREQNRLELAGELTADEDGLYKDSDDPRITAVGHILRRFSVDELPQLLNVVRGEMSLVGPRPSLEWEVDLYPADVLVRQRVRPGLTGAWQVAGRNLLDMNEMLELDADYACHRSTATDLMILLKTPFVVLTGRGAR